MRNNKIQFLLIFFVAFFSFNAFGVDYFWLTGIEKMDGSRLAGVEVGRISEEKLKKFFNKDLTIIYTEKDDKTQRKIQKVKLASKIYIYDRASNINEEDIGVSLTRSLAIKVGDEKKSYGYIAIPEEYKIEDVKVLRLVRSKFMDKHKPYLDAIKSSEGVIPDKTATFMLSNTDSLTVFEDVNEATKFSIIRGTIFLDKKPVIHNSYGFSPFVSESSSVGFLLKVNGKKFFLAEFGHYVQRKHMVERMVKDYYLVDLEEGKIYLPMHLREEESL